MDTFAVKDNYYTNLYRETLNKTERNGLTISRKELRFFSLFSLIDKNLKNNKLDNVAECGCWFVIPLLLFLKY